MNKVGRVERILARGMEREAIDSRWLDMRRTLNIRLDAPAREHRGGLARFDVDLDDQGLPLPIVVRDRVYVYAGEETTREGLALWSVFADTGPAVRLAA